MDDDWGLNAIVRGCSAATSSATSPPPPPPLRTSGTTGSLAADFQPFGQPTTTATSFLFSSSSYGHAGQLFSLSSPSSSSSDLAASSPAARSFGRGGAVEDLHELYKPFFPKSEATRSAIQAVKSRAGDVMLSSPAKHGVTTPRSKKRKNQVKKVCQVPAESLSSDIWAWRKYGQKPIKGSPYPRGYYRCSSSKGCLARKQVERNRTDPGMFIVTYTAEHNHPAPTHRNSLAGSTRQKPSDPSKPSEPPKPASPATSPENDSLAPVQAMSGSATESKEGPESSTLLMDDEEEDDEFGFSDVAVSDEFFVGLEGLGSPTSAEFLSDNFPASFGLPWPASSAATAAGGR